ncbi:MAG: FecR domain-containing protein [Elusimicrobiota bacterium]
MRILTLLLSAVILLPGAARAQEAEAPSEDGGFAARITELTGEVYLFHQDEEEGYPAEAGAPVEPGDRIETRGGASAEVALEADSVLELGANTVFTIDSLEKEKSVFALALGSMVAKFRAFVRRNRGYQVLTPTAVAAVRGTEFGVEVGDDGGTSVGVFDEGEVAVTTTDEAVEETVLKAQEEVAVGRRALDTEEVDGRRRLRKGKLRQLQARRQRMQALRARRGQLRKTWQRLSPELRRELRQKMRERHQARLQKMPKKKRLALRQRMRRVALKNKVDRGRHQAIRRKLRQKMDEPGRRGRNMRRQGRERYRDMSPEQKREVRKKVRQQRQNKRQQRPDQKPDRRGGGKKR